MGTPYTGIPYLITLALAIIIPVCFNVLSAQVLPDSTSPLHKKVNVADTVRSLSDSALKTTGRLLKDKKQQLTQNIHARPAFGSTAKEKLKQSRRAFRQFDTIPSFSSMLFSRPAFRLTNGYVNYNFNYRTNIDTPYLEKNIQQHNVLGQFNAMVAGSLPVQVNYWLRQSNSRIFRNIADVQVSFNGSAFQGQLQSTMRNRLLAAGSALKDTLLELALELKEKELFSLADTLKNKFHPQKLTEAGEILTVPRITYDVKLPDSINKKREETSKKEAALFIDTYKRTKHRYDSLMLQRDSLKTRVEDNRTKLRQYNEMVNGGWEELRSGKQLNNKLQQYGMQHMPVPGFYRWLMGIRNFSVGRSPANYSELTARNISVNGINFEYNSWYYLALAAGSVNYRFRDFVVNGTKKVPQYLVLARAGLGSLEKNYFILSSWRGQKQLFGNNTSGHPAITITGFSMEGKWALNRNSWLKAEVAQSISPDIYNGTDRAAGKFNLRDKNSQAVALQLYSYIPFTGLRVEGFYKKTGANYQSFNSYQSNTEQQSWYVKGEQNLFNRRLRISGALRSNEYTNPLIVQNYKSNTIFKSVSASLRIPKWPMVTVGYQPMSQLTKVEDEILENRFQTLNATLYHGYTFKQLRMATTAMVNKFYNNNNDTAFAYYNATNTYLMQSFFFTAFTANVAASLTKNVGYTLQVLDGYVEPAIGNWGTVGAGIKINNMNHTVIKAGAYVNASVRIGKQDMIFISYEHGYLPSVSNELVGTELGSINYTRTFNFK